jgi:hypothetical protein
LAEEQLETAKRSPQAHKPPRAFPVVNEIVKAERDEPEQTEQAPVYENIWDCWLNRYSRNSPGNPDNESWNFDPQVAVDIKCSNSQP